MHWGPSTYWRLQDTGLVMQLFIFMSTNKVYGDAPNTIKLKELETRWDYEDTDT